MFKGLIADSIPSGTWREKFNILNRAACVIGMGEEEDIINYLVANVLVRICLKEAMNQAKKDKDYILERAVIIALSKYDYVKLMVKIPNEMTAGDFDIEFLISILLDQLNKTFGTRPAIINYLSNKVLPPILRMRIDCQIHTKYVKPVFESLMTFDYTNPDEWYNNWYRETFPEEKKE
jgi:hypothetical protein